MRHQRLDSHVFAAFASCHLDALRCALEYRIDCSVVRATYEQAAEFGTALLKRNGELEAQLACLNDELAVAQAKLIMAERDTADYQKRCAELRDRVDSLMRESLAHCGTPRQSAVRAPSEYVLIDMTY